MNDLFHLWPLLPFLYAEVHYTFHPGFSLVYRDFPEIIADLPWRLDPGQPLPILCLVKDAHRYPIRLDQIVVTVQWAGGDSLKRTFPLNGLPVCQRFWHRILEIPREDLPAGPATVDVHLYGRRRGGRFFFRNDNYRRLSHAPLRTMLATHPLPGREDWYAGDAHVHSSFTEDQVEFGAPPEDIIAMARAMGLRWTAITDHSYDLDDSPGDPLAQDPTLEKWRQLNDLIPRLNDQRPDFVVLLGEEISCGNSRGRNVHLLALGARAFIPGSGDGAERWPQTTPTLTIPQALEGIRRSGGIAYAAHPEEGGSPLERILLRRGRWTWADYLHSGLSGLQVHNGHAGRPVERGLERWVKLLLQGRALALIGGNDAHGNFNRFRQLWLPFVALRESQEQVFGRVRTYLFCPRGLSRDRMMAALDQGQAVVTDGPLATLTVRNHEGQKATVGESLRGDEFTVEISARSSEEFGALERVDLFWGRIGDEETNLASFRRGGNFRGENAADIAAGPFHLEDRGYLRLEARSRSADGVRQALTNPVWINVSPGVGRDGGCPR